MSKLADIRGSKRVGLPERNYELCLAQVLIAEDQALETERETLLIEHHRNKNTPALNDGDGEPSGPPRRAAQRPEPTRVAEINARLEELFEEMREHTGKVLLRAKPTGEWLRWVAENPPREDSELDAQVGLGQCDADALFATLEEYAVSWDGEPFGDGDWAFIIAKAAPGDLLEMCRVVVQMQVGRGVVAPPKSRSSSPATAASSTGSASPETSESPASGS